MKKIVLLLLFALAFSGCQQMAATATPTHDALAPYYGTPEPATVIVNGKSYKSGIGTTKWIYIDAVGSEVMAIGDAFAIITPVLPIVITSPFSLTLELPIPLSPTEIAYSLIPVTDKDRAQEPSKQTASWNPLSYPEPIFPPLMYQQELTFSADPGLYVLDVLAGWGGTKPHVRLRADYGFLIEIQE